MTLEFVIVYLGICVGFFGMGYNIGALRRIDHLESLQADLVYSLYHQIYLLEVKVASYERATTPPDPQGPVYETSPLQQSGAEGASS